VKFVTQRGGDTGENLLTAEGHRVRGTNEKINMGGTRGIRNILKRVRKKENFRKKKNPGSRGSKRGDGNRTKGNNNKERRRVLS